MSLVSASVALPHHHAGTSFHDRLNGSWHERALQLFMVVVLAHWAEHLAQVFQIYVLGWPVPSARGVLGLQFPWLVSSELLHYGYAVVMLALLWILRSGFVGTSRRWWTAALVIQFWHHIEHALLQGQAIAGWYLFNSPVPTSIAQLWFPRVELHLFYNTVVFVPMVLAMYYHLLPPAADRTAMQCSCAVQPHPRTA